MTITRCLLLIDTVHTLRCCSTNIQSIFIPQALTSGTKNLMNHVRKKLLTFAACALLRAPMLYTSVSMRMFPLYAYCARVQ
jgi:hypothetical protein